MRGPARAEVIARAAARLAGAGVAEAERDARRLFAWAARLSPAVLSAAMTDPARPAEIAAFDRAVERREARVPVSQITGARAFWRHEFRVTADVLDPRPETEVLVRGALEGPAPARILDLGTGSGCILLSLLAAWGEARGTGTDASAAALRVAETNAAALGLVDRATFVRADWTREGWAAGLPGGFDLIVSNPPYLAASEVAGLAPEVRFHEPRMALTPGGDGLGAYRAILAAIPDLRAAGGARLLFEIGPTQGAAVAAMVAEAGGDGVAILPDLDGRDRVVVANLPRREATEAPLGPDRP